MKKIALIICVLFFETHAQTTNNIFILPASVHLNQLSAAGYSSITGNSSNTNSLNPASIRSFKRISAGFTYQVESNLKDAWIFGIGTKRIYSPLPQSAGIIFPADNFSFGIGMNQVYSSGLDMGLIKVTTSENPDGTGELFYPKIETSIINYSAAAAFSSVELLSGSEISAGIRAGYNLINYTEEVHIYSADVTMGAINFAAGALLKNDKLQVGLSFESGFDEKKIYDIKSSTLAFRNDSISYSKLNLFLRCRIPARVSAGIFYNWNTIIGTAANFNYIFWNETQSGKNEEQFSASLLYNLSDYVTPSVGFMYASKTYDKNLLLNVDDKMNALYILLGIKAEYQNFYLDFSLADSQLTGGEWRKHSMGKISLGYNFN